MKMKDKTALCNIQSVKSKCYTVEMEQCCMGEKELVNFSQ